MDSDDANKRAAIPELEEGSAGDDLRVIVDEVPRLTDRDVEDLFDIVVEFVREPDVI